MILKATKSLNVNVTYLTIDVAPRYWENSQINGIYDNELYDDEEPKPQMLCRIKDRWVLKIEIETGKILNWDKKVSAQIHYKVCDTGEYELSDCYGNIISRLEGYVPECLCPAGSSYGDYIIMNITEDGIIENFKFRQKDLDAFFRLEDE